MSIFRQTLQEDCAALDLCIRVASLMILRTERAQIRSSMGTVSRAAMQSGFGSCVREADGEQCGRGRDALAGCKALDRQIEPQRRRSRSMA